MYKGTQHLQQNIVFILVKVESTITPVKQCICYKATRNPDVYDIED